MVYPLRIAAVKIGRRGSTVRQSSTVAEGIVCRRLGKKEKGFFDCALNKGRGVVMLLFLACQLGHVASPVAGRRIRIDAIRLCNCIGLKIV